MKNKTRTILTAFCVLCNLLFNFSYGQTATVIDESFVTWPAPGWKIYQFGTCGPWVQGFSNATGHKEFARLNNIPAAVNDQNNWLVSPPIKVNSANYKLTLHTIAVNSGNRILISNSSGVPTATDGSFVPVYNDIQGSSSWAPLTVDLSAYAIPGQTIYIAFQVKSPQLPFTGMSAPYPILSIDDVHIGPPASTAYVNGALSAVVSPTGYSQTAGVKPTIVKVTNNGTSPLSNYTIDWSAGGLSGTFNGTTQTSIDPAGFANCTLSTTTSYGAGIIHTINATLKITPPAIDINTLDNSIASSYSVGKSNDVVLTDIWPKGSGSGLTTGFKPVIVNVYNKGSEPIGGPLAPFKIEWSVNNGTSTAAAKNSHTESVVEIQPGQSRNITVSAGPGFDFSNATVRYRIDANLVSSTNLDPKNNTKTVYFNVSGMHEDFNNFEVTTSNPHNLPHGWTESNVGNANNHVEALNIGTEDNNPSNYTLFGSGEGSVNSYSSVWGPLVNIKAGDVLTFYYKFPTHSHPALGQLFYRAGPGQTETFMHAFNSGGLDGSPFNSHMRGGVMYTVTVPPGLDGTTKQFGLRTSFGGGICLGPDCSWSGLWDDFSTTANLVYPIVPGNLNVSGIPGNSASLSWLASANATNYSIRYRLVGSPNWIIQGPINVANYTLTGLLLSSRYEVQVRAAKNANDSSDFSSSVIFLTSGSKPAPPVIGLVIQPSCSYVGHGITLNGLPSGAWTVTRNPGAATITSLGGVTTATFANLTGGLYTFTVTNTSGTSAASAPVTMNAAASLAAPHYQQVQQPTCIPLVPLGSFIISGLPESGTWTLTRTQDNTTTVGSGTSHAFFNSMPNGTYNYKVTTVSCPASPISQPVVLTQPPTIAKPSIGTITPPSCFSNGASVILYNLPGLVGTVLYRQPGNVNVGSTINDSITLTKQPLGTYTYTVDVRGCTNVSNPVTFTLPPPPTNVPAPPTVSNIIHPSCSSTTGSYTIDNLPVGGALFPGDITYSGTSVNKTNQFAAVYPIYYEHPTTGCLSPPLMVTINPSPSKPDTAILGLVINPTCQVSTGSVYVHNLPANGTWTLTRNGTSTATTIGTGSSLYITGLQAGTFNFTVTQGCVSFATPNFTVASAPTSVPPTPTATVSGTTVTLNNLPALPANWVVYYTDASGATVGSKSGTGLSTTITGLAPGTYKFRTTVAFCQSVESLPVTVGTPSGLTLQLTALIEGLYSGSGMTTVADNITVELHNTTAPYAVVAPGAIQTGQLSTSGTCTLTFTAGSPGVPYYIVVKHQNALQTWSMPVTFSAGTTAYDFTTSDTKAYSNGGSVKPMKLKGGKWCFYSGDVDQSGVIEAGDYAIVFTDAAVFKPGPIKTDLNGDGTVEGLDATIVYSNSAFIESQHP